MENTNKQFLYGASVQGIQSYIFQTNELRDIIGASELVRQICTERFEDVVGAKFDKEKLIIAAAGNVKYLFDNREECERVVLNFPKRIMQTAPGVTVSQAVVELTDGKIKIDELEKALRAQRNKPMRSMPPGLMGMLRSRKTGLPAVKEENHEYLDEGALRKKEAANAESRGRLCEDAFGAEVKERNFPHNVSDMCYDNNWLAVIHADGNGLGQIVSSYEGDTEGFRKFSQKLDNATKGAAQKAFEKVFLETYPNGTVPVRPIVVGGDDFTVMCRGSEAIRFVAAYLEYFETQTKGIAKDTDHLTACAGIAFIKSNYPFYYGYQLAEELCGEAKKACGRQASCLMFHKVQDSFVTNYEDIERRELTPRGWSYKFGPYYVNTGSGKMTAEELC